MNSRLTTAPSTRRHARRPLATLGLLLVLAACGRDTPKVSVLGDVPGPLPAQAVLTAEEPTTTTAIPETRAAPEPARADVVASAPVSTEPVARRSTTSTTTRAREVVQPPVAQAEPAPQVATTIPRIVEPPVVLPGTLTSHGGPVRDHVSLVDNLRGRGLTVTPVSSISQPFLHGDGTSLAVSGPGITATQLQSYEYATAEAAAADAATIGPNGSPRNAMVSWVSAPHLYLRGRVIVIYVGTDAAMTSLLTDLLGTQFAGR